MSPLALALLGSLARTAIGVVSGAAIAKGYVTADTVTQIVGAGGVLVTQAWSWYQKYSSHKAP